MDSRVKAPAYILPQIQEFVEQTGRPASAVVADALAHYFSGPAVKLGLAQRRKPA